MMADSKKKRKNQDKKRKASAKKSRLPKSFPRVRRRVTRLLSDAAVLKTASDVPASHELERARELPANYGDNQIFIMVRDPYWIYAYWEIQKEREEAALNQLGGNWNEVKSILRVYDTTDKNNRPVFFNIDLSGLARTWYIEGQPNRSYVVEIGLLHNDGRFIPLARSNEVTTPRAGMSEIIDEQWMAIDFEKMYALSGGFEAGKSSQELKKLMEERLAKSISSGSGAGASPVRK